MATAKKRKPTPKPAPGPVLHQHIKLLKLPPPTTEHRFHPSRLWRLDFAWPELMLALEIEGVTRYGKNKDGSMKLGRHQTAKGLTEDCIKYAEAEAAGWTVLRFTQDQVRQGVAINYLEAAVKKRLVRSEQRESLKQFANQKAAR